MCILDSTLASRDLPLEKTSYIDETTLEMQMLDMYSTLVNCHAPGHQEKTYKSEILSSLMACCWTLNDL